MFKLSLALLVASVHTRVPLRLPGAALAKTRGCASPISPRRAPGLPRRPHRALIAPWARPGPREDRPPSRRPRGRAVAGGAASREGRGLPGRARDGGFWRPELASDPAPPPRSPPTARTGARSRRRDRVAHWQHSLSTGIEPSIACTRAAAAIADDVGAFSGAAASPPIGGAACARRGGATSASRTAAGAGRDARLRLPETQKVHQAGQGLPRARQPVRRRVAHAP